MNKSCPVMTIVSSANAKKHNEVQSIILTARIQNSRVTSASMTTNPTHTAAVGCPAIIRTPYKPHAMKPALGRTPGAGFSVSGIRRLSVFVERKQALDTDQFEVIGMGRG